MKTSILKIPVLATVLSIFFLFNVQAQVGIGTNTPHDSAILDLTSSGKGFLPPRMTEAVRDGISSAATGLLIFNTDTNNLNYFNGTVWKIVDTSASDNFVDLTSNQAIAGNKAFSGTITAHGRLMIPMGEISYYNTVSSEIGLTVDITSQSTGYLSGNDNMKKINPGTANTPFVNDMFGTGENSTLKYIGTVGRYFHIALSFSYSPFLDNDVFIFGVAKTDDSAGTTIVQDASKVLITTGRKADYNSTAMHVLLWLDPNDSVEFWCGNVTSGSRDLYLKSFNFVAIGM